MRYGSPIRKRSSRAIRLGSDVGGVTTADDGALTVEQVVAAVALQLRDIHEARELVAAVMEQSRSWPSVAATVTLPGERVAAIAAATDRRRRGAPLAYAVRSAPFRHLLLYVDERVLIPRPETEYLIDLLHARGMRAEEGVAVDVGTGSGAIALALATEFDFARLIATDISSDALAVAQLNAERCTIRGGKSALRAVLDFRQGDGLAPLRDLAGYVELLVSNPPYIAFAELPALPPDVRDWEPPQSLVCSDEGLAVTRALVAGGGRLLRHGGTLALETDSRRAQRVAELVRDDGAYDDVQLVHDLTGRERFVVARRRSAN